MNKSNQEEKISKYNHQQQQNQQEQNKKQLQRQKHMYEYIQKQYLQHKKQNKQNKNITSNQNEIIKQRNQYSKNIQNKQQHQQHEQIQQKQDQQPKEIEEQLHLGVGLGFQQHEQQQDQQEQNQEQNKTYFFPVTAMNMNEITQLAAIHYNNPQKTQNHHKNFRHISLTLYCVVKRLYKDCLRAEIEEKENDAIIIEEKLIDQSKILTKQFLETNFKQKLNFELAKKFFGKKHRLVFAMPDKLAIIKDQDEPDDDDIIQLELAGINYDEIEFELESVERCFWLDGMRWYDYKFKNSNKIYTTKSCDLNEGPMKAAKRIFKNPRTNRNKKPFGIR